VSATPAWPVAGPPDRDELASWSTAELADVELGSIPPLAGPLPQGWTELVDGRGVFVRRQRGPEGATPVWFVHGLGGSSTDWTRLSGALSRYATAYSLDLPGSGRSDPPPRGRHSPLTDADVRRLGWTDPACDFRWRVPPGLTGLAQVAGTRSPRHALRLDRRYIARQSWQLDVRLIAWSFAINVLGKDRVRRLIARRARGAWASQKVIGG